jgi:hypothetical protein
LIRAKINHVQQPEAVYYVAFPGERIVRVMWGTSGGVVVAHGGGRWHLKVGDSLTVGRSQTCGVRLVDPEISRHACLLRVDAGFVMVFNQSTQKPLAVRPLVGEDRRVGPSSATASLPYRVFDLVFAGRDDEPVSVRVDARALTPPAPPAAAPDEEPTRGADDPGLTGAEVPNMAGRRAVRMQAALLTPAQRIVLIAMCEPMLTRNGAHARPRSTSELADRLSLRPDYARNVIKDVRYRLSEAGVPGLVSADGAATLRTDLRLALARWAIEWGAVTVADLADLPRRSGVVR